MSVYRYVRILRKTFLHVNFRLAAGHLLVLLHRVLDDALDILDVRRARQDFHGRLVQVQQTFQKQLAKQLLVRLAILAQCRQLLLRRREQVLQVFLARLEHLQTSLVVLVRLGADC